MNKTDLKKKKKKKTPLQDTSDFSLCLHPSINALGWRFLWKLILCWTFHKSARNHCWKISMRSNISCTNTLQTTFLSTTGEEEEKQNSQSRKTIVQFCLLSLRSRKTSISDVTDTMLIGCPSSLFCFFYFNHPSFQWLHIIHQWHSRSGHSN